MQALAYPTYSPSSSCVMESSRHVSPQVLVTTDAPPRTVRRIPVILPFANPYIPWPRHFDYLSHFASITLAFARRRYAAKFQKAEIGQGKANFKLMMCNGVEDQTVGY
jgi:hypothetical protein